METVFQIVTEKRPACTPSRAFARVGSGTQGVNEQILPDNEASTGARSSYMVRTAWIWLLVPVLILILFGIGDIVRGTDADPAIVEGLTGLEPSEIEAVSPEAARYIDVQYRFGGIQLTYFALVLSSVLVFGFRRWQRWAWFTMWAFPLWAVSVSAVFFIVDRPDSAPIPPPMASGIVFFVYAAFWLTVSYRGFVPREARVGG